MCWTRFNINSESHYVDFQWWWETESSSVWRKFDFKNKKTPVKTGVYNKQLNSCLRSAKSKIGIFLIHYTATVFFVKKDAFLLQ